MFMLSKLMNNPKALYFAIGFTSATIGVKFLKSQTFKEVCVKELARGMRMRDEAMETLQNIREEAADIYVDAKNQACATE